MIMVDYEPASARPRTRLRRLLGRIVLLSAIIIGGVIGYNVSVWAFRCYTEYSAFTSDSATGAIGPVLIISRDTENRTTYVDAKERGLGSGALGFLMETTDATGREATKIDVVRVVRDGNTHLVALYHHPEMIGWSTCVALKPRALHLFGTTETLGRHRSAWHSDGRSFLRTASSAHDYRVYKALPLNSDESRFIFEYSIDGVRGRVEGEILTDGQVWLTVVSGPLRGDG